MSDRYSSAYSEALRKNREEQKRKQRRFEMKEKIKSLNPFRVKEKKDDGSPPIRTKGWTGKSGFKRTRFKATNRPRNVVYVIQKIDRYGDLTLPENKRNQELDKAERRIEQDPDLRKYYYKYAQETLGGMPTFQEKEETKKFLNNAIANYPKSRDQQNRFAVAYFMVNKYGLYRAVVMESGADKSYQKWYRRYAE